MNFATLVALLAVALMVFLAVRYIYRERKKGRGCIGCPYAGSCGDRGTGRAQSCDADVK